MGKFDANVPFEHDSKYIFDKAMPVLGVNIIFTRQSTRMLKRQLKCPKPEISVKKQDHYELAYYITSIYYIEFKKYIQFW